MAAELDGTANKDALIIPYDAHDQVLRAKTDYQHQEYPKAVGTDVNGEPVLAQNAEHEAELTKGKE